MTGEDWRRLKAISVMLHWLYMKGLIGLGILIGGGIGTWIGMMMDHGNGFGLWSIVMSTVGSLLGIWGAIKANEYI